MTAAILPALAGWVLVAFAGAYTVLVVPFIVGSFVVAYVVRPRLLRTGARGLDIAVLGALAAVAMQVVPLAPAALGVLSRVHDTVRGLMEPQAGAWTAATLSLDPTATLADLALGASYLLLFWSARSIYHRGGGVRVTVRGIALLGLALSLLVVVQRPTSPHLLYWRWTPEDGSGLTVFGPFVNRNHLATWLVMAIPLVGGYLIAHVEVRERPDYSRQDRLARMADLVSPREIWLLTSIVLMTLILTLTLSRSGLIGGAGALAVAACLARGRLGRRERGWVAIAAAAILLVVLLYANLAALVARIDETLAAGGGGGRWAIWRDTRLMIRDFWPTGVGVGAYQKAMLVYQTGSRQWFFNQAHNQYLQVAAEGGLLVGLPLTFAGAIFSRMALRRLRADRSPLYWVRAGAISGLAGVALQSVWETGLRMPANAALCALVAAIAVHAPQSPPRGCETRPEPKGASS